MITDGPADLPHLGCALGIRNVPTGHCTYACVYCEMGGTARQRVRRRPFHRTEKVVVSVRERLARAREHEREPDYLTFLHGGEPTLDVHLGAEIERLRGTEVPVAVVTNASLLWRDDVRTHLLGAHRVVIKLDTVDPETWRRLNRPGAQLRLNKVLDGVELFCRDFRGVLDMETTLVPGVNDGDDQLQALTRFLAALEPDHRYMARTGEARR